MKSKSNKNLGLSPIKQNKYSIRKFKLGAASVTVASLLIFGTAGVAKAAEVHGADKAQQAEHVANVAKSDTAKATEAPPAASTQQNEVKTSEAPNTAKAVTDKEAITPTAAPKEDKVVSDKATTQDKKETRGYKANNTEPQKGTNAIANTGKHDPRNGQAIPGYGTSSFRDGGNTVSIDGGKITASGHVNVDDRVNTTTGISYDYTLNFKEGAFHEGDTFKIGIKELGEDTRLPKELKADDGTTFAIRDSYKSLYNNPNTNQIPFFSQRNPGTIDEKRSWHLQSRGTFLEGVYKFTKEVEKLKNLHFSFSNKDGLRFPEVTKDKRVTGAILVNDQVIASKDYTVVGQAISPAPVNLNKAVIDTSGDINIDKDGTVKSKWENLRLNTNGKTFTTNTTFTVTLPDTGMNSFEKVGDFNETGVMIVEVASNASNSVANENDVVLKAPKEDPSRIAKVRVESVQPNKLVFKLVSGQLDPNKVYVFLLKNMGVERKVNSTTLNYLSPDKSSISEQGATFEVTKDGQRLTDTYTTTAGVNWNVVGDRTKLNTGASLAFYDVTSRYIDGSGNLLISADPAVEHGLASVDEFNTHNPQPNFNEAQVGNPDNSHATITTTNGSNKKVTDITPPYLIKKDGKYYVFNQYLTKSNYYQNTRTSGTIEHSPVNVVAQYANAKFGTVSVGYEIKDSNEKLKADEVIRDGSAQLTNIVGNQYTVPSDKVPNTIEKDGILYVLSKVPADAPSNATGQIAETPTRVVYKYTNAYVSVTPENPGHPGQPIDPNNPSIVWPRYTDLASLTKSVTRTIKYVDAENTSKVLHAPVIQTVKFTRTPIVNVVNGRIVGYDEDGNGTIDTTSAENAWVPENSGATTWPEQTSPKANELTEQGYHETTTPSVAAVSVNASTISTEVLVKYQRQDKEKYEPTPGQINHDYGTPTTADEVKNSVKVPGYPTSVGIPTITVDNPNQIPNGQTPGTVVIPVTVTYPDGSKDKTTVTVVTGNPLKDAYEPSTKPINKPFGTPTTADEVKKAVTVPDYPSSKGTPEVTIDDQSKIPNGQTPGTYTVPVTVTYPDGSKDHANVTVNVGNPENSTYEPHVTPINKPFGTPTTADEVKKAVTVPDYPSSKGTPEVTIDDQSKIPNGQTPGTHNVPVTVTYPDGSKDHVNVPVNVGDPDSSRHEPKVTPITKDFGTPTTADDVTKAVIVPDYPSSKGTPTVTVDNPSTLPNGQTPGTYTVPATVTYPDGSKDHVNVPVTVKEQPDKDKYEPKVTPITKGFGKPTTADEVKKAVTVPDYPSSKGTPTVTVDNPSTLPNGQTPGTHNVPVTVTYPDGTKDHVNVPVTVGDPDSSRHEPKVTPITKDFGTPTTTDDVTKAVTVPDYPSSKGTPVVTVDNPSTLPNGQTPGTYTVPATVTYPDGSKDHVNVPVTVKEQPDKDKYEPKVTPITKDFGTPTTADEVKKAVTVPDYPSSKGTPVVTVDNPNTLPDGQTPGTHNVPVTVTYPDGTKDHVDVPVTVKEQPDKDKYEPKVTPVTKDFGTPTTADEVKKAVTVPDYPSSKGTPVVTVDNPSTLPNGQTPGTFTVPATVTYPDGTKDHVDVPVTVKEQPDKDKYEPTTKPITKSFGTPTTADEVQKAVTVPGFPSSKGTPVVTVDNPSTLPNGQTPGTYTVPVTVTYPDGTKDHTNVTVNVGDPDSGKYEPKVTPITKDFGTPTTTDDVTKAVTVPNYPSDKPAPKVSVDDPSTLPNGKTPGEYTVPVTVTYPDGTKDHVNVPVKVGNPDSSKYEPKVTPITKDFGTPTTADEVKKAVTVPDYPSSKGTPVVTIDNPSTLPNGQTPGTFTVPATVTYPDGSKTHVDVPVTVKEQPDKDKYEPKVTPVTKDFGTPTTADDVTKAVTVPDYPSSKGTPTVTVDNPSTLPNGQTPGTFTVPATVTYPDGTKDHVDVPVTVKEQPDKDKYEPKVTPVTKDFGTPTTADEVKKAVTVPDYPSSKGTPIVTVDNPSTLPNGRTPGEYTVPVTVTYPDGTKDHVNVPVKVGDPDSGKYEPKVTPITKDFGTPTTADDVTKAVTVPDYPSSKGTPTVTVDNPSTLPNGQTPGTYTVPATVTYPDGSKDHVNVPVTVKEQPDKDKYEPKVTPVTKDFGTPTTADDVTKAVTVPDYPSSKGTPKVSVDNPSTLPNGQTPGTYTVPVTVTYPDGTKDHVDVPVTVKEQPDKDKYEPSTKAITKPFGTPTTADEVKKAVTVPNYPSNKPTPEVSVDDSSKIPDGNTTGTFTVPVTVTYPDGTKDHTNVTVNVGNPDSGNYPPKVTPITKDFGTPTTADDVTKAVTVPDYPSSKGTPTVTVDNPSTLPDGHTPGAHSVPVTVTYPDGSKTHVDVPVTVKEQPDKDKYEPSTKAITKPFGTPTTADEVKKAVTVPNYPSDKPAPKVSVDDPSTLPNGKTPGEYTVPVTVTYPDGSKDHVNVTVKVGDPDSGKYEPKVTPITKDFGTPTTADDVTKAVTVPNYPSDKPAPKVSVDDPSTLPNGKTPGTYTIPVTVTYPDGSKDHVNVTVKVGDPDSGKYEPKVTPVTKDFGTPTTTDDVTKAVTVPNYPSDKPVPKVSVDDPSTLPNGKTPGTYTIPVTVTYPDGSKDHVNVTVKVGDPDSGKYEPKVTPITKDFGTPTTADDVIKAVTVPNYPSDKPAPKVTVDNPSTLPNGKTPGTVYVPVTVTYPDGSKDHVTVSVTTRPNKPSESVQPVQPNEPVQPAKDATPLVDGNHVTVDTQNHAKTATNQSTLDNKHQAPAKASEQKSLPDTGQKETTNTTLFAGLFAALATAMFVSRKRRKDNK
ncbi:Rib/alpha-like domain-containing protein [Staphylococcus lugdunensis]|uniref:Rib/alpha-like domain-containing protein n=9 Tax=Staphylococcus TaxID=1279 RepID=UPI0009C00603|nr:Rib/alpha-like domain-containing protein [Staphylococcus lugdunensis]AUY63198.1 YSIRK signal domain/LPXTG anchor domain surface protein [Staphylococcus lugdunensis]